MYILVQKLEKALSDQFCIDPKVMNGLLPIKKIIVLICVVHSTLFSQNLANYVNNGGFEECGTCGISSFKYPKFWGSTDSLKYYCQYFHKTLIPNSVPLNSFAYQWPRNGDAYIISLHFCPTCPGGQRGYPRNRLKENLKPGSTYCFEMYVNLSNQSSYGIDALGVYFADSSVDTIKNCNMPITYLTPQISNTIGNYFSDTLGWIPLRGSFVANGTEKYLMIGNFKSNVNTNKVLVNNTNLPAQFSDNVIDDVSLIDMNLVAFAGKDTAIVPGDSAFIGRTPDVGINEACQWFKLPNMTTALDTVAGLWVKPVTTTTYVVRQQLWCSGVKWDTVVIHMNPVGFTERLKLIDEGLRIFPVPANDKLTLNPSQIELMKDFESLSIYNNFGEMIREEKIFFVEHSVAVSTTDLPDGIYSLYLRSEKTGTISKRFVIQR